MVTSLTNVTGGLARLLLSVAVLFFNGLGLGPVLSTQHTAREQVDARPDDGGNSGFHASVTVGRGKKQVTVQLEFGHGEERAEDESL